jgi:hypothetical protein
MEQEVGVMRRLSVAVGILLVIGLGVYAAIDEVEPNEAPAQAQVLEPGFAGELQTIFVSGSSGYEGDIDWYSFNVASSGPQQIRISVAAPGQEYQIVVYRVGLEKILSGDNEVARRFEAGSYVMRVQAADLVTGAYNLYISNSNEIESNDGVVEATPLGVAHESPLMVYGAISPVGDNDFYSFEIQTSSGVADPAGQTEFYVLALAGPGSDDPLLTVYGVDEGLGYLVPQWRNDDAEGDWSTIISSLQPGHYVARVEDFGDSEEIASYSLTITRLLATDREPNNAQETAYDLGAADASGKPLSVADYLAPGDADFYSFSVSPPATGASSVALRIATSGSYGGDSVLRVYDSAGTQIAYNDDAVDVGWLSPGGWSMAELLPPVSGQYYVKVSGAADEEAFLYTLMIETFPYCVTSEVEPNNAITSATKLDLPCAIAGRIDPADDTDIFRFTLDRRASVTLETVPGVSGEDGDTYICLYGAGGSAIDCDDDGGQDAWSRLSTELEPGIYWVTVEDFNASSRFSYRLLISVVEKEQ